MKKKKERAVLLHILFVILVVVGVTIMYTNMHYGEGIRWLSDETYEDTQEFTNQFRSDIDSVFDYITYKDVFETDGKVDYSKPMIRITDGPGLYKEFTVDEMIQLAKSYGYYLNENFKVSGGQHADKDTQSVRVEWRAYDPDIQYTEPGQAYITMTKLAREAMEHVGNYYAFIYRFIQNPTNFKFEASYSSENEKTVYSNVSFPSGDTIKELKTQGSYLYIDGESLYIDSNLKFPPKDVASQLEKSKLYPNSNYYMVVAVNTAYPFPDAYQKASGDYDTMRLLFIIGLVSLGIGTLGCAASLYYMICLAGHQNSAKDVPVLAKIDRIATEGGMVLFLIMGICALFIAEHLIYKLTHLFLSEEQWFYGELVVRVLVLYTVGLAALFSLIRRYKAGTLWHNSLLHQILVNFSLYFKNHRFTTRLIVSYLLFLLFNMIVLLAISFLFFTYDNLESRIFMGILILLFAGTNLWVFHQTYKNAWETDQINDAVVKISEGDTTYKINTAEFFGKEQELAENINHISNGLETALQEKVSSERLKADLITNVSHDIKTPLTSIINYVDLIKREHLTDPKIQGYLEVLEQKSQRLKTLTEDLVEASKASSGNLKLEVSSIDFVELVWQTNGEFEEKFALRHLDLVPTLPDEVLLIKADGRHLWRVLENLYNNAFKYAMERSRVYVDVTKSDGKVVFVIKNISENPLNIRADELTERFVRGDVARTTEGSGLGLSIAKSLTELQGGEFSLYIDGDLFKAEIKFDIQ